MIGHTLHETEYLQGLRIELNFPEAIFKQVNAGSKLTHVYTRLKKKNVVFPVTLPTLIFCPYPKVFIKIFLFFITSYIMLFVEVNQVQCRPGQFI